MRGFDFNEFWQGKRINDVALNFLNLEKIETVEQFEKYLLFEALDTTPNEDLVRLLTKVLPVAKFRGRLAFFVKKEQKDTPRQFAIQVFEKETFLPFLWEREFLLNDTSYSNVLDYFQVDYKAGIQILTILFVLRLKMHHRTLDLYQIYDLDKDNQELQSLIQRVHDRINKNSLPVDSLIFRSLALPQIDEVTNLIIQEDLINNLLKSASKSYSDRFAFLKKTPELLAILKYRQQNNNIARNLYGHEGHEDFDIEFRKVLMMCLPMIFKFLRYEIIEEELVEFLNLEIKKLIESFKFFNEKFDSINRKLAATFFDFINEIITPNYSNLKNLEDIANSILLYLQIQTGDKHSDLDRKNFLKNYYVNLQNGDFRLRNVSSKIPDGTLSFYRSNILIRMALNHPEIALRHSINLSFEYIEGRILITLLNENFQGSIISLENNDRNQSLIKNYLQIISSVNRIIYKNKFHRNIVLDLNYLKEYYFDKLGDYFVLKDIDYEFPYNRLENLIIEAIKRKFLKEAFEGLYLLSVARGEFVSIYKYKEH